MKFNTLDDKNYSIRIHSFIYIHTTAPLKS